VFFPFAPHLPEEASFLGLEPGNCINRTQTSGRWRRYHHPPARIERKAADFKNKLHLSRVLSAAAALDLTERLIDSGPLAVHENTVSGRIEPHRIATIRVKLAGQSSLYCSAHLQVSMGRWQMPASDEWTYKGLRTGHPGKRLLRVVSWLTRQPEHSSSPL